MLPILGILKTWLYLEFIVQLVAMRGVFPLFYVCNYLFNKQPADRQEERIDSQGHQMDREQWAHLKATIRQLYIDQNLNCKQVAAILRQQHDDRVRYQLHSMFRVY